MSDDEPLYETRPVSTHADKNRRLDEAYAEIARLRAALPEHLRSAASNRPLLPPNTRRVRVETDPTELLKFAVSADYEYEPGEYGSEWIAREMSREVAEVLAGLLRGRLWTVL